MISNVLFDAIDEIEKYQREMPDAYDSMQAKIDDVKKVMRELQHELDHAPVEAAPEKPLNTTFIGNRTQRTLGDLVALVSTDVTEGSTNNKRELEVFVWPDGFTIKFPSQRKLDVAAPDVSVDALISMAVEQVKSYAAAMLGARKASEKTIWVNKVPPGFGGENIVKWFGWGVRRDVHAIEGQIAGNLTSSLQGKVDAAAAA